MFTLTKSRTVLTGLAFAGALGAASTALPAPWIMRHGLTPGDYQNFYDVELPAGYRPIAVAADGTDAGARYTAVWVSDGENDWAARHGLTSAGHQAEAEALAGDGYRMISLDVSGDFPNERYASIWVDDDTPAADWGAVHRRSFLEMQSVISTYESNGLRPVWLSGSGDGANRRFAATFVRNVEGWTYETMLDLTESQYQDAVEDQIRRGFRVLAFSGYGSSDPRISAIFVRTDGNNWEKQPRWFARHNQTGAEFQQTADDHYNITKFQPVCVAQYEGAADFGSVYVEDKDDPVFTATGAFQPDLWNFDSVMESFMTSRKFQRGALAVTRDGRLVYNRAFTYDEPDAPDTQPWHRFRVASVSKPFTAVAVLKAVEMDLFDLDDTLGEIPGFPDTGWGVSNTVPNFVTIDMLLKHQGGWDRDLDPMLDDVNIAGGDPLNLPIDFDDIIDAAKNQPLEFFPGTGYEYSNFGYALLGRVIELTSGQAYDDFVREHVLCPVGAETMVLGRTREQDLHADEVNYEDLMFRHFPSVMTPSRPYELYPYSRYNIDNMGPHGGWVATVEELAKFVSDFTDETDSALLTSSEIDYMFNENSQTSGYGAGWQRSGSVRYHNGLLRGTWAYMIRMDNGVTISVLFNGESGGFDIPTAGSDGDIRGMLQDAANQVDSDPSLRWPTHDLFRPGACQTLPCPGDITGDGFVNAADLGRLIALWGRPGTGFDLDGDGVVGAGDLAVLIGGWGPCP